MLKEEKMDLMTWTMRGKGKGEDMIHCEYGREIVRNLKVMEEKERDQGKNHGENGK